MSRVQEEIQDSPARPPGPQVGFTEGPVGNHLARLGSFMAMGTLTMNVAQLAEAGLVPGAGTK